MKGHVLGFDGTTGAIRGEGGDRFRFSASDWSGPHPPKAQDEVDFVATGDKATEIYPVRSAQLIDTGELGKVLGQHVRNAGDALGRAGGGNQPMPAMLALVAKPQIAITILMLLACLLLHFMMIPGTDGAANRPNLLAFPGNISADKTQIAGAAEQLEATQQQSAAALAQLNASMGRPADTSASPSMHLGSAIFVFDLAPLVFLLPVGAVALIVLEFRGKRMRLLELGLGGYAIAMLVLALLTRSAMTHVIEAVSFVPDAALSTRLQVGFGAWIIGLCGAGLIAVALGMIRRIPGLPQPSVA